MLLEMAYIGRVDILQDDPIILVVTMSALTATWFLATKFTSFRLQNMFRRSRDKAGVAQEYLTTAKKIVDEED